MLDIRLATDCSGQHTVATKDGSRCKAGSTVNTQTPPTSTLRSIRSGIAGALSAGTGSSSSPSSTTTFATASVVSLVVVFLLLANQPGLLEIVGMQALLTRDVSVVRDGVDAAMWVQLMREIHRETGEIWRPRVLLHGLLDHASPSQQVLARGEVLDIDLVKG